MSFISTMEQRAAGVHYEGRERKEEEKTIPLALPGYSVTLPIPAFFPPQNPQTRKIPHTTEQKKQ
jgi:hypothetical protein